jgi:hypothetical protein
MKKEKKMITSKEKLDIIEYKITHRHKKHRIAGGFRKILG